MSLLARAFRPRAEARSWFVPRAQMFGGASPVSANVDVQTALRHSATFACQRILVATVAKMPVDEFVGRGARRTPVDPARIVVAPSGRVSRRGWVAQLVRSQLQCGNAYGRIVAVDGMARPTQIETISPLEVTWQDKAGELIPYVSGREMRVYPGGDLWHVPVTQFLLPGTPVAISPTEYAAQSIGTALAAEDFGSRFFSDGGHTTMAYVMENDPGEDVVKRIKESILATQQGSREPLVIGGIEPKRLSLDPNETQFIDVMRFEVEQACRFWGVPPSMVYSAVSGQNVTYANISQDDLQFLKMSVEAWIVDLEDAWSALLTSPRYVKFNTDAVLRMDTLTRYRKHELALRNRLTTVNEVRAYEDEAPFGPEFDEPGVPARTAAPTVGANDGADAGA